MSQLKKWFPLAVFSLAISVISASKHRSVSFGDLPPHSGSGQLSRQSSVSVSMSQPVFIVRSNSSHNSGYESAVSPSNQLGEELHFKHFKNSSIISTGTISTIRTDYTSMNEYETDAGSRGDDDDINPLLTDDEVMLVGLDSNSYKSTNTSSHPQTPNEDEPAQNLDESQGEEIFAQHINSRVEFSSLLPPKPKGVDDLVRFITKGLRYLRTQNSMDATREVNQTQLKTNLWDDLKPESNKLPTLLEGKKGNPWLVLIFIATGLLYKIYQVNYA